MAGQLTLHKGLVMMAACRNVETYAAAQVRPLVLALSLP
jgi:hypothetical protein